MPFTDAVAEITALGATIVPLTAPNRPATAKIVDREFKRDLDAYLAPYGKSTAGIVAFNDAHPGDTLKFGQARLRAAAAIDLTDPATATTYATDLGERSHRVARPTSTRCCNRAVDAILSLTATMAEVGTRAGYPQVSIPAGYDPTARRPQSISFTGTAGDDAKLLGFGYAYERAALVRQTPSEVMPQTWHCVAPIVYIDRSSSCGPGEVAPADVPDAVSVPAPVGGTVPATLSLTLGAPATFGAVDARRREGVHGLDDRERGQHRARRDADRERPRPPDERDVRAAGAAAGVLQPSPTWTAPVSNDPVTIGFKQAVKASDALRTGAYRKTLTFTLSTTNP